MKSYKCLVCGNKISSKEEHDIICPHCHSKNDIDILLKKDKLKVLKYDTYIYLINKEFKKIILFLDDTYNSLLLEYFKIYSHIKLNKEYDETIFYNKELDYTDQELDLVINHMFENSDIFDISKIMIIINKSNNKDKYINAIDNLNTINEKYKEKELRELLFHRTKVYELTKYDGLKREGKVFIYVSIALYILTTLLILLFTQKEAKYDMLVLTYILPSYLLSAGVNKAFIRLKSKFFIFIMFAGTLYITTFLWFIVFEGVSLDMYIKHFIEIIKSPIDLFKTLLGDKGFGDKV